MVLLACSMMDVDEEEYLENVCVHKTLLYYHNLDSLPKIEIKVLNVLDMKLTRHILYPFLTVVELFVTVLKNQFFNHLVKVH